MGHLMSYTKNLTSRKMLPFVYHLIAQWHNKHSLTVYRPRSSQCHHLEQPSSTENHKFLPYSRGNSSTQCHTHCSFVSPVITYILAKLSFKGGPSDLGTKILQKY